MRSRRGATDLAGVLLVDKPAGMTSHDVVNALRKATGERRIGHAGTLDPMATGLLLVLVGRATRLEQYLVGHDKRYEARVVFGSSTDTLDAEGAVTGEAPVPESVLDPQWAGRLLAGFLGGQEQMPPAYSAIKRGGVAAHKLARAGEIPELEARAIRVYEADLCNIELAPASWDVNFAVSKGTYIRSLARDIGLAAGTLAHLGALRRTRIGDASVANAISLQDAVCAAEEGRLPSVMTDPVQLLGLPAIEVDPELVRDGRRVPVTGDVPADGERAAIVAGNLLLGVYHRTGNSLRAESVLEPGVCR